ncbi:MAG: hypothetical protein NT120_04035 [Candidatus Aenigmarchaeota archaeon]|nr:hypothetical protein [Candidatus Aenigmarchaeota archaeon]
MPGRAFETFFDESYRKLSNMTTPECQQVLSQYELRHGNFLRLAALIFLDNDKLWGEYLAAKEIVKERQKQAYSVA